MARTQSNPNLHPFGHEPLTLSGLTAQEQAELPPHERIQGVWPLLLKLCSGHAQNLQGRGFPGLMDELLQEIVVVLLERDKKWNPGRGNYTTFVNIVWRNVRQRQDETRGVVLAPNHAWARLKKLKRQQEAGVLSQQEQITMRSLEIVHRAQVALKDM